MANKHFKNICLILVITLFTFNNIGNSQLLNGDSFLSVKSGILNLNNYSQRNAIGINLDIMVTDNVGIHYDFLIGEKHFHGPAAPIGGGIVMGWMLENSNEFWGPFVIGVLLSVIPEGVSYNINLNPTISLSPYVSPLQFDYIRNADRPTGTDSFVGCGLGFKTNLLLLEKKIRIAPFGEYKMHYHRNKNAGWFAGIALGWNFNRQVEEEFEFE